MATVYIGSARIDERGKASGGQAGNQNVKELSKQAWYDHSKRWYCFRARDRRHGKLHRRGHGEGHLQQKHRLRPASEPDAVQADQGQGLRPDSGDHALRDGLRAAGARLRGLCL